MKTRSQFNKRLTALALLIVSKFRRQHGFEPDGNLDSDQVASLPVRLKLNDLPSKQTGEMATALV